MLAAIGVLAILGLLLWPSPEPRYQNKPLSYWVNQLGRRQPGAYDKLHNAVTATGPNAIPYLLRRIRREDAAWEKLYRWIWPKLPNFAQTKLPQPQSIDDITAAQIGSIVSLLGAPALPFVRSALNDHSSGVRLAAVAAFSSIDPKPAEAVAIFARLLNDSNGFIRVSAAIGLTSMGTNAVAATEDLIRALKDSDIGPPPAIPAAMIPVTPTAFASTVAVRANAAAALGKIGPEARAGIPALRKLMSDANSYVREQAAVALW